MKASEYNYKLPDDYTFPPEIREKLDDLVHKLGLSEEQAQAFIDIHVELTEDFAKRLTAQLTATDKEGESDDQEKTC